jgi:adenosylcobinamide kinase/adenosylcobinamide-phosphate guanylyltransferase
MIVFVTGGSGSGKSEYAESVSLALGKNRKKIYLATMRNQNAVSQARVDRHRKLRAGKGFETLEQAAGLERLNLQGRPVVLLECLSNLLANEMFAPEDGTDRKERLREVILGGIRHLAEEAEHLVIVSNQVFSDGLSYDRGTRRYMQALGGLNAACAEMADEAWEVVCGIPNALKKTGAEDESN